MNFNGCKDCSVGVEWELQLLDKETLDLFDGIMPLMEFFPDTNFVQPEFIQSCVELTSDVSANSDEAIGHIGRTLEVMLKRCEDLDMGLCAAGTHPFSRRLGLITPMRRYRLMEKTGGYLASHQITFSSHVHIGMRSGDEAMRVMYRLVSVIPALMAVSANSPFWRGHVTRHAAYRHRILAAAPNYGLPMRFKDWAEFNKFLDSAIHSGAIKHFKDVHWDIRPHPDFGTIEIRAMDAAPNLRHLHGIVSFARCLVVAIRNSEDAALDAVMPSGLPQWIETQNRYSAARRGMDAEFIIDSDGNHRPMREFVDDLMDFCQPFVDELGEREGMRIMRQLLKEEPAYEQQLQAYRSGGSARCAVEFLKDELKQSVASDVRAA